MPDSRIVTHERKFIRCTVQKLLLKIAKLRGTASFFAHSDPSEITHMKTPRFFLSAAILALSTLVTPARAVIDLDNDGVGDVWRTKFSADALAAAADADGDGKTNADEAKAGTDPFSPTDIIKVTDLSLTGGNIQVSWPSIIGKRYKVQSSTDITNPSNWSDATGFLDGSGGDLQQSFPAGGNVKFYRVAVYEKDSDGDGVDDWEEIQLGLDPESGYSHGLSGQSDLAFVTGALTAPSVVTIRAAADEIAENSLNPGVISVVRTGGIKPITVNYTVGGGATAGSDYTALTGSVVLPMAATSATIIVTPTQDAAVESPEAVIVTLSASPTYTLGEPKTAAIIITDETSANGTGLFARFYNEATNLNPDGGTAGVAPLFTTPAVSRVDATIDYDWPTATGSATVQGEGSPAVGVNVDYFACRWTGEVLPEFSQIYTFSVEHNRATRLWVNGQLLVNKWPNNGATDGNPSGTSTGTIPLIAGVRVPIVLEHFETTNTAECHLRWSSANQALQVIPASRMFPTVAPQITSPLEMYTFVGGTPVNYQITASSSPTGFGAANLPPGLTVSALGLISGSPTQAGEWNVVLTASNPNGSGSAILKITVLQTSGGVTREQWDGVTGSSVASIPTGNGPTSTSLLTSLQAPSNVADSYGARIRGYITAAATGTYTFWLSGDDAARLYISDDEEPVNAWLRAELTAPSSVAPDWSTAAKTEMLQMYAGRRYYFEVLHKEDSGSDNLAIGWAKPGQPTTAPSEVVPGYVLTQYIPATPLSGSSTLYTTAMGSQGGAVTGGFGSATLLMSADKTTAKLFFTYGNLTTGVTAKHLHSSADGGQIVYDIDDFSPGPDGSYTWNITSVAGITDKDGDNDSDAADVVKLIENGDCYINIHTANYPNGEIRGNFRLAAGSQTFTAPPAPPSFPDDHTDYAAASRFLSQATFGASPANIAEVQALGYEGWIDAQFAKPITLAYPFVFENRARTDTEGPTYGSSLMTNSWWKNAVTAEDQLRQRFTFALSEILVTSTADGSPLDDNAHAVSDYYDMLLAGHLDPADPNNQVNPVVNPVPKVLTGITGYGGSSTLNAGAFGNFRDILLSVTLHPAMGRYLDMVRNDKPNITTGQIPNENYAREIKQLFSLGLNRLHPDGTLILDSKGLPIPTYDQDAIIGFAHVFTGWDWWYADTTNPGGVRTSFGASTNYLEPMREVPVRHFTGQKRLLNNVVIPGLPTVGGLPLDPYATHSSTQYNDAAYRALPAQELLYSHDKIFNHPNVGPFICRQLIQRLVTSTPSPGYVYRVVSKFNDNGSGVRGDMKAVVKAILLDYEARSVTARQAIGYGKQREPIIRVTNIARAFPPQFSLNGTWQQDGGGITINTTAPHGITSGQTFALTFGDSTPAGTTPLALSGTYTTSTLGGTFTQTATSFAVRAKDAHRGTYAKTAGGLTVTVTSGANHGLATGTRAYVRFRDGALTTFSGLYPITVTSATVITLDLPAGNEALATTGTPACDISVMTGSYSLPKPTAPATTGTCTITCNSEHGLTVGANVYFDFKLDTSNFSPVDDLLQVASVIDKYRFTVTAAYPVDGTGALVNGGTLSNQMVASAETPVLDRGGHAAGYALAGGYGDFTVGNTDTSLGMTPMGSPTVFNFYLPDYQYPGEIAAAGLYTPEFQLTSDTTTIGQANYLYNGIFNPSYTTGISSFNAGGADIAVDISPWMNIRPGSATPWTDNDPANSAGDNLRNFIREMSKLLMAGQMSTAMEDEIYNYVTFRANPVSAPNTYTNISYTNGATTSYATATTTQLTHRRDRARSVIHLIVTSPQFTIQK